MPTAPNGPAYTPEPGATAEAEPAPALDPPGARPADAAATAAAADDTSVGLDRIAWCVTSVAFAIGALILLMRRDYGYASVAFAVSAAAGINLL
jgi:hypothetical protein